MTFVNLNLCSGVNTGLGFNNPKSRNEKHDFSLVVMLGKESRENCKPSVPSFLSLKMLLRSELGRSQGEQRESPELQSPAERAEGEGVRC